MLQKLFALKIPLLGSYPFGRQSNMILDITRRPLSEEPFDRYRLAVPRRTMQGRPPVYSLFIVVVYIWVIRNRIDRSVSLTEKRLQNVYTPGACSDQHRAPSLHGCAVGQERGKDAQLRIEDGGALEGRVRPPVQVEVWVGAVVEEVLYQRKIVAAYSQTVWAT